MADQPVLSICVPSRNRQEYFQHAIRALTASPRSDVEFIFTDNSDDPAVMSDFMVPYLGDPRVTYLPSTGATLSMIDNWERTLAAATGRWVSVIGDDDHIDPEVATLLLRLEQVVGPIDALSWNRFAYHWPVEGEEARTVALSMDFDLTRSSKADLLRRAFQWAEAASMPRCGNSVYHGAVSGALLNRIRDAFGKRFFETPIVDYEMAFKVILTGQHFYKVERPFSVDGVCPQSNSATAKSVKARDEGIARFNKELGFDRAADPLMADTPFRNPEGVAAAVYAVQHWLSRKYGLPLSGFEANLTRAMAFECSLYRDRESYDTMTERYRALLAEWDGGRHMQHFTPRFTGEPGASQKNGLARTGFNDKTKQLILPADIAGVTSVSSLYGFVNDLLVPADEIPIGV